MDWKKIYTEKLVSLTEAAEKIESNDSCWMSACTSAPIKLVESISERYMELKNVTLVSGLALYPFKFLQSPEFKGRIDYHTIFMGPIERAYSRFGNVNVNSLHFSQLDQALSDVYQVKVLLADVSEPDEDGYMYYGPTGVSFNHFVKERADKVIVNVNKYQPKVNGEFHRIHVSEADWICKSDHPLPAFPQTKPSETDEKIAEYLVDMIPDGSTIQIGVGGLSNAVGYRLETKKDLSVHTEMFTDSMVYLAKKGVINGKMVAGFALGNEEVNSFASEGGLHLIPTKLVNDPYEIAKNDNFVSINASLMADLTGQVCSESIGFQQYSCTGGQVDFVRGATMSKGGMSFICIASTVKDKDGSIKSTINTTLPPGAVVTTTRSDVMYVVTEYGVASLKNKSIRERVESMILVAHPDFREQLREDAIVAGLIQDA